MAMKKAVKNMKKAAKRPAKLKSKSKKKTNNSAAKKAKTGRKIPKAKNKPQVKNDEVNPLDLEGLEDLGNLENLNDFEQEPSCAQENVFLDAKRKLINRNAVVDAIVIEDLKAEFAKYYNKSISDALLTMLAKARISPIRMRTYKDYDAVPAYPDLGMDLSDELAIVFQYIRDMNKEEFERMNTLDFKRFDSSKGMDWRKDVSNTYLNKIGARMTKHDTEPIYSSAKIFINGVDVLETVTQISRPAVLLGLAPTTREDSIRRLVQSAAKKSTYGRAVEEFDRIVESYITNLSGGSGNSLNFYDTLSSKIVPACLGGENNNSNNYKNKYRGGNKNGGQGSYSYYSSQSNFQPSTGSGIHHFGNQNQVQHHAPQQPPPPATGQQNFVPGQNNFLPPPPPPPANNYFQDWSNKGKGKGWKNKKFVNFKNL